MLLEGYWTCCRCLQHRASICPVDAHPYQGVLEQVHRRRLRVLNLLLDVRPDVGQASRLFRRLVRYVASDRFNLFFAWLQLQQVCIPRCIFICSQELIHGVCLRLAKIATACSKERTCCRQLFFGGCERCQTDGLRHLDTGKNRRVLTSMKCVCLDKTKVARRLEPKCMATEK